MSKIGIRESFGTIVDEAKREWEEFCNKVSNLNAAVPAKVREHVYTNESIKEAYEEGLQKIEDEHNEVWRKMHEQMRMAFDDLQKNHINPMIEPKDVNPGYAVKVQNAIQFIQSEGKNITDDAACNILFDLRNDYETMRRFEKMIEQQKGELLITPTGETLFPKTFGNMRAISSLLKINQEIDDLTAALYVRPVKYQRDERNSIGGIVPKIPNPVRLTDETRELELLDISSEMESLIVSIQDKTENGGYKRFLDEGRADFSENGLDSARGYI